jgi:hypothetical protein
MTRLCLLVLACVLLFTCGCSADGDKKPWYADALSDLRGDNQRMTSDFGGAGFGDSSRQRSRD